MSESISGPERSELGKQYDKYQEAIRIGFAQGQASKEARIKELEEALDFVIPRCVICLAYATKFNPKKMWPVCDDHSLDAGGATQVVDYHNAIKATEALKKLKG